LRSENGGSTQRRGTLVGREGEFDFALSLHQIHLHLHLSSSTFAALQAEVAALTSKVNRKAQGLCEKAEGGLFGVEWKEGHH